MWNERSRKNLQLSSEVLCSIYVEKKVKSYKNDQTHLYRFFYE